MGAWGYFDDENDETHDYWDEFMNKYSKKHHKNIYKILKSKKCDKYEDYYNKLEPELKKERVKVANEMLKFIKNKKFDIEEHPERPKIGLINIVAKLGNKDFSTKLPKKLFTKFPKELSELACKLVTNALENDCGSNWKDIKKRKRALNIEAKLYKCKLRTQKGRKSPFESATLFNIGKKKKGLDGKYWIVKKTSTGVKRWVRLI